MCLLLEIRGGGGGGEGGMACRLRGYRLLVHVCWPPVHYMVVLTVFTRADRYSPHTSMPSMFYVHACIII